MNDTQLLERLGVRVRDPRGARSERRARRAHRRRAVS